MAESAQDLASLVEVMVRPLIDNEDDLTINVDQSDDHNVLIEVEVNEDDAGKVIGRQGRIIKAIRTITRAAAARMDAHVDVELAN